MGRRERRMAAERMDAVRADRQAGHMLLEEALRSGDLGEVRALFDDDAPFPNVEDPLVPVSLLVRAIDVAPLTLIRALLAAGADPDGDTNDGFPPLYSAVTSDRRDRDDIIDHLLDAGVDPNQRGINDYTVLHAAAACGDRAMADRLLAAGADPTLRTRIDDWETPAEVARICGHAELADHLEAQLRRGSGDGPPE